MEFGEVYLVNEEQSAKAYAIAKTVLKSMEAHYPIPFEVGLNALILALTGAIATADMPTEKKVRLAEGVGGAILANMFQKVEEGSLN